MDIRTLICGIFAVAALVCATVLYVTGEVVGAASVLGLSGTALGYVVGLHSEPWDNSPEA